MEALQLKRPSVELVTSYLELLAEIASHGERVWSAEPEPGETANNFVERLLAGDTMPEVGVPQTTFWVTLGETVVGHIGLRHRLNAKLAQFGGHVGYTVRPSYRRRGFAKEMLRQVLRTPKAQEIGKLLLTCAPENVGSNRTIVANGGVLERTRFVPRVQRDTSFYWIDVTDRPRA